jgi:hypothetical protein
MIERGIREEEGEKELKKDKHHNKNSIISQLSFLWVEFIV